MQDRDFIPAEAFPPGRLLRKELTARGWTQTQFAGIIGRPVQLVSEIIQGRKRVTEQTALEIGAALGTSATLWINLETGYQFWKLRKAKHPAAAIERRAEQARRVARRPASSNRT